MDTLLEENCAIGPGNEERTLEVMKAGIIYILMKSDYRISRGVRTQWFLEHIDKTLTIPPIEQLSDCKSDLTVVSVIPQDSLDWDPASSHTYTYLVTPSSNVVFLSHMYSMVYCLDMSPSLSAVDIQHGQVMVDDVFLSLKRSLDGITRPFAIPGCSHVFQPEIYVTVIAHTPFFTTPAQQVLMQGYQVTPHNLQDFLASIQHQLELLEDTVAQVAGLAHDQLEVIRAECEKLVGGLFEEKEAGGRSPSVPHIPMVTPDAGFINMLRYGMLALRLLPESSSPSMIVITDGIICGPDVHIFDSVLTQLRTSTIACSFFHVGSLFHPHCCQGLVPYVDLMQFIAHATGGVYMNATSHAETLDLEMNAYHSKLLVWSFKKGSLSMGVGTDTWLAPVRGGDWHVSNTCFYGSREPTLLRKKQLEGNLLTSLISIVCCRLKEGYAIKSVKTQDNQMELCLVLPWKDHIYLEYVTTISLAHMPGQLLPISFSVSIQAPYEFLHDITCKLKKPFQSQYRQAVVTRFWATLNSLSQSDQLVVHLNTFPTNSTCYTVPESIRSGMPLFYLPANSSVPVLSSTDLTCPQFAQFWRPICQLDHTVWHKWLHSHRLGLLLLHDHPLPRHLHLANPSGRFQVVQCRQAAAALYALLKDLSTFVLIENQSYVKLVPSDSPEKPPKWFYIMRASSKPPYVVINVAFLGGTPSRFRNLVIRELKQRIEQLSFPQRPKANKKKGARVRLEPEEPLPANPPAVAPTPATPRTSCCILLKKPVEKILVRYERMPSDFGTVVFPDGTQPIVTPDVGSTAYSGGLLTTLSRYLHHRRWIWAAQNGSYSSLGLSSVARILSIITKMRLQEGFHFAHSTAGIINMVLEVDMRGTVTSPNGSEAAPLQPCVIQYVLFPPHSTVGTSKGSGSDDEITEDVEADSMIELEIIAECWIEPQHGLVVNSPPERMFMENLPYFKLPDVMCRVDAECISSLLTFEQLSLMCRTPQVPAPLELGVHLSVMDDLHDNHSARPVCALNVASLPEQRIHHIPFPFNLLSILPNCHQAEQMYSMLIQDLGGANVGVGSEAVCQDADASNHVLCDMLLDQLKSYHERELFLSVSDSSTFLRLTGGRGADTPRWRCFARCVTPLRLLLTFVPASYSDLKLLTLAGPAQVSSNAEPSKAHSTSEVGWSMDEKGGALPRRDTFDIPFRVRASTWDTTQFRSQPLRRIRTYSMDSKSHIARSQVQMEAQVPDERKEKPGNATRQRSNTECSDKGSNLESPVNWGVQLGALSLPVYMYDCPLTLLVSRLVRKDSNKASHLDENEGHAHRPHEAGDDLRVKPEEGGLTKQHSPEPKSDDSENVNEEPCLKEHCRLINQAYSKCFVVALFMALHQGETIAAEDVQTAVDECEEALIEVDITRYIKTVCGHLKEFRLKKKLEEMKLPEGVLSPDGHRFPLSQLTLCSPCRDLKKLHSHIKNKFTQIITLAFKPIPSHPELFYCSPDWEKLRRASQTQACELFVERLGRERHTSDIIDEDIEFCSGQSSLSTIDDLQKSLPSEDESDGSSTSDLADDLMTQQLQLQPAQGLACPLFLHLTCSVRSEGKISSCSVRDLPTCLAELLPAIESTHVDLDTFQVTLDILCLTLPSDVPEGDGMPADRPSFSSSSPIPADREDEMASSLGSSSVDNDFLEEPSSADHLQHLPAYQHKAVTTSVDEIKWLLRDEMAALFLDEFPLQEQTLHFVADHVASSPNRPSCIMEQVPLHFVFGPEKSLNLFLQEFYSLNVCGYHIMKEGDLDYLVMDRKSKAFSYLAPKLRSSRRVSKLDDSGVMEGARPSPEHLRLLQVGLDTDSDEELFKKRAIFKPIPRCSKKYQNRFVHKENPTAEMALSHAHRASTPILDTTINSNDAPSSLDCCMGPGSKAPDTSLSDMYLTSEVSLRLSPANTSSELLQSPQPTHMSPAAFSDDSKQTSFNFSTDQFFTPISKITQDEIISSPEHFFIPVASAKRGQEIFAVDRFCDLKHSQEESFREHSPAAVILMKHNLGGLNLEGTSTPGTRSGNSSRVGTEDGTGYEGDSSDSGEDSDWIGDLESKQPSLPDFWLVMRVDNDAVTTYFHHRVLEGAQEDALYRDIHQNVVAAIKNLSKLVNQTLLLQSLHNTRMCDQLLEPQASEDIWKPPPLTRGKSLEDGNEEGTQSSYLEATMKFMPGWFACSVVWETHLGLHPRLKSGPGFSRGMQALRAVLNPFSVNNRANMFVYQDTGGNVYYLRLHENVRKTILSGPSDTEDGQSPVPVSRSSSVASLGTRNPPTAESTPVDMRPRVRSFGEKDSPSPRPEDSVILKVHGISAAGNEVKQDLVQVLQNRLDDAVLEVLLIMLERNPMCKLTPDDVHFIQKPLRPPESVIRFTIQTHALPYLQALDFYLRQNLMQFLHTPKYTDPRSEFHFQDYSEPEESRVAEADLFVYNQTLSSGSKGIACLALALVDPTGSLITGQAYPKPRSEAFLSDLPTDQFDSLTWSDPCWESGEDPRLEFRVWKQGRVNLESLTQRLRNAVRHAHWDLLMEYRVLTAPLPDSSNPELHGIFREPMQLWLNFAVHLAVPAVKRQGVTLNRRHSLAPMLKEVIALITLNASDTNMWMFSSSKQEIMAWSPADVFPNSEDDITCLIIGRNLKQWQACVMDRGCYDPDILHPKAQKGFQKFPPLLDSTESEVEGQGRRFVPRQRFLLAALTNHQMLIYTYNWSKERVENLYKQVGSLGQWLTARAGLLNNIITQKMGLFHPQKANIEIHGVLLMSDVEQLMKFAPGVLKERRVFPSATDLFRDCKLVAQTSRLPTIDPVISHSQQVLDMRHQLNDKEDQKKLYIMWQTRGATPNIPLAEDILMLFRQHARTIHYCMTPLLFLPSWRVRSAATRDHALSNQTSPPSPRSPSETWHFVLCTHFVTEYKQYLQTLGFIPIQTEPGAAFRKQASQRESEEATQWCIVPGNNVCYLQKSLLGGILLLELVMCEPFFHAKLHALECSRLQSRSSTSHLMSQFTLSFVDECDRMKVLLHLHSFTYDYHLRSAHAYLSGKSITLKQGYHLTHFLEDFLKYYNKAPNFARNLVFSDMLTASEITTPARQLYNYLLSHEKMYNMEAFRMVPVTSDLDTPADNEYALVHVSQTPPVTYRDAQDVKQTDDFDVTLVVWHEGATDDDHVLTLQYYIILTSRRELYPKLDMERKLGKFRKVSSADAEDDARAQPTLPVEIRRESVNYLGYYSSHEQLMQRIMYEQASEATRRIRAMVEQGSVHCRTHLLWTKLQCGGLCYAELEELRGLSVTESLGRLDARLAPLLCQSLPWYHALVRVLQAKYSEHHRLFQSPDGNETHVVVLHPRYLDAFMLLSVDVQSSRGDLCAVYRKHLEGEPSAEQLEFSRGDIQSLVEGFVNTCCFHLWAGLF